jgi:hypothetical protein
MTQNQDEQTTAREAKNRALRKLAEMIAEVLRQDEANFEVIRGVEVRLSRAGVEALARILRENA